MSDMTVGLPLPKKVKYRSKRQVRDARYAKVRPEVREKVWLADGQRCVWPSCRQVVVLKTDVPHALANIHELGKGRGHVDPCDPNKCVTTCSRCHGDLHVRVGGKRKRILGDDRRQPLVLEERHGDTWVEVARIKLTGFPE